MNLSPAERGALRHLEAQLDHYRRHPSAMLATTIERSASALSSAAETAEQRRREQRTADAEKALADLVGTTPHPRSNPR